MRRIGLVFGLLLLVTTQVAALEVKGVNLEPTLSVQGESLQLNGYGLRKKFFMDIYLGSLYTAAPATTTAQVLADPGSKMIRMNFLYKEVERGKITDAFQEGFKNNSPQLTGSSEVKNFLAWFTKDFRRGDLVELELGKDGTVAARHNGASLGSLKSTDLARGVLLIYLGEKPADDDLKVGMLKGK